MKVSDLNEVHCLLCLARTRQASNDQLVILSSIDGAAEDDGNGLAAADASGDHDVVAQLNGDGFVGSALQCKTGVAGLKKHLRTIHNVEFDVKKKSRVKRGGQGQDGSNTSLNTWLQPMVDPVKDYKRAAVKFVTELGLPFATVRANQFLDLIVAASKLQPNEPCKIQNEAVTLELDRSFSEFVADVKAELKLARTTFCGEEQGSAARFVSVCHDGWTKADREVFGISFCWICPVKIILHKVAVAFTEPINHTAAVCALQIDEALAQFGLSSEHVLCSVNDTTSAALATAKLISPTGGTCNMHVAQLIMGYAVAKQVRKASVGVFLPVGPLQDCDDVFACCSNFVKGVMGVACTARLATFHDANLVWSREGKIHKIGAIAETRVASAVSQLEGVLRHYHSIERFRQHQEEVARTHIGNKRDAALANVKLCPTKTQWTDIAEIAARLQALQALAIGVQKDNKVRAGWFEYKLLCAWAETSGGELLCAKLSQVWSPDWSYAAIPKMPVGLPHSKGNNDRTARPIVAEVQHRALVELAIRFPFPKEASCLAMAVDPGVIVHGFQAMRELRDEIVDNVRSLRDRRFVPTSFAARDDQAESTTTLPSNGATRTTGRVIHPSAKVLAEREELARKKQQAELARTTAAREEYNKVTEAMLPPLPPVEKKLAKHCLNLLEDKMRVEVRTMGRMWLKNKRQVADELAASEPSSEPSVVDLDDDASSDGDANDSSDDAEQETKTKRGRFDPGSNSSDDESTLSFDEEQCDEQSSTNLPTLEALYAAGDAQVKLELNQWRKTKVNWKNVYAVAFPDEDERKTATKDFPAAVWAMEWYTRDEFLATTAAVEAHCDMLLWYRINHTRYPILTRLALRYSATPSSNAFQERVFSSLTFMAKQRQRGNMGNRKFNVSNVLRVNKQWIAEKEARELHLRRCEDTSSWTCESEKFFGCCQGRVPFM
jgi:hypothetical protein